MARKLGEPSETQAELGTSVSALVRNYLKNLMRARADETAVDDPGVETELERRRRLLNEVIADFEARGVGLRMADNLPREALYDRDAARAEAETERRHAPWAAMPCTQKI